MGYPAGPCEKTVLGGTGIFGALACARVRAAI